MDLTYDSDEPIGRGSAAEVWSATDEFGRKVAVKFFRDDDSNRVRREVDEHAKGLARVEHPSVVRLYTAEDQPHPERKVLVRAIIMERVEGDSLSKVDSIDDAVSRKAIFQICGGLEAMHAVDVVHGDFHEGNVIITASGARIIDILYKNSLRDVGTRTATATKLEDVRAFAIVVQQILEKSPAGRARQRDLSDARFMAEKATTPSAVVQCFAAFLEEEQPRLEAAARAPVPQVARAPLLAGDVRTLASGVPWIGGLAVTEGHVYYSSSQDGVVYRVATNGMPGALPSLVANAQSRPIALSLVS